MMLSLKDVTMDFVDGSKFRTVLNKMSLEINEGDYISIQGKSGSGKTTLLNIISGLLKPTSGSVMINETDIYKLKKSDLLTYRRENVGFVFQNYFLDSNLTVYENVLIPLLFQNGKSEEVLKALDEVKMLEFKDRLVLNLSGGEKQRVSIARAIVNKPKYIFADEPTGNLDKENSDIVMNLLESLNKKGHTIILITHDIEEANRAKRKIKLVDGALLE